MSALLARLIDDAALFPPERTPLHEALPAYRAAAADPATGRFLCPASRFAELRTHLVPEDLLDLGVIADTGIEELPKALDAVRAEPRVRPASVRIALPGDADQARAAAVTIARLPPGVPAHIEVRRSPGWRDALDRVSAARDHGAPLGAASHMHGPAGELAAFIAACAERDLPFTLAGPAQGLPNVLLAAARAAAGERDVRRSFDRTDPATDLRALTHDEARATRRLLIAFAAALDTALTALSPLRA